MSQFFYVLLEWLCKETAFFVAEKRESTDDLKIKQILSAQNVHRYLVKLETYKLQERYFKWEKEIRLNETVETPRKTSKPRVCRFDMVSSFETQGNFVLIIQNNKNEP